MPITVCNINLRNISNKVYTFLLFMQVLYLTYSKKFVIL